jgi:glycine/D-amino acid oxidase-like deaminating enzyme
VGLSQALRIKEELGTEAEVTLIADKFLSETTSCGSGGLWEPYQIAGTPDEKVNVWGKVAFDHFLELLHGPDAARAGVQLLTAYNLMQQQDTYVEPSWKDIVFNFRKLEAVDLAQMGFPARFTQGFTFGTLVIEQRLYMDWLMNLLRSKWGVTFRQQRIESLEEFTSPSGEGAAFDIVINCTGIGAGKLLGKEDDVYPIRGQVLRVKAPWMNNVVFWGTSYIIPNVDTVVLGGTAQRGNWDTTPSEADTRKILDDVCELFPAMRDAPIETVWAGLRPGRTPLRLESSTTSQHRNQLIVHNYGHGGSGITLAMGCADDVVRNHILPFLQKNLQYKASDWVKFRSRL